MNRRERLKERHWQRWGFWAMILLLHLMILPLTDAADIPTDFPIDIPFDSQTDIPLDSQIDIPLDSQTDIPLDSQIDIPLDSQTDIPLDSPIDIPGDIEIEDPFDPSDPYTDIPLEPNIGGSFELRTGVNPDASDLEPETITPKNFSEFFGYTAPPEPALTLDGRNAAAIGVLWTGQIPGDEIDLYRGIQVVIDTNGDQTFSPLNWNDPSHPWNRPDSGTPYDFTDDPLSWEYTYPPDYPDGSLRNTTIRLSWDESCWCAPEFPTESFDWAWYFDHNGYDTTEIHWLGPEEAGITVWEGRDTFWNLLPNGDYRIQVTLDADGDARFRENEPTAEMLIRIDTAIFRGRVVDGAGEPVPGAQISAYSPSVWTTAQSDAEGKFILTGLVSGEEYFLEVRAKGKVTAEIGPISLQEGEMEKDLSPIPLKEAVAITGTLKLDADGNGIVDEPADLFTPFMSQWGWEVTELEVWLNGWNLSGPGWGSGSAVIREGRSSVSFTLYIPANDTGLYEVSISAEGYAAPSIQVITDRAGGDAGTIVLTRASMLFGTVKLPAPVKILTDIEANARRIDGTGENYWGWGEIDPSLDDTAGTFRFDGLVPGEYEIEVRVTGFKPAHLKNVEIRQGEEKDLGEIPVERGKAISGTLTILGDTTDLPTEDYSTEYDPETGEPVPATEISLWVEAWNIEDPGRWSGMEITAPRGVDQKVEYILGGLESGRFEIYAELSLAETARIGYELIDGQGNSPVFVDLVGSVRKDLFLKPFEGIVTGKVTGEGVDLDYSKVMVSARRPWDWMPPKIATVEKGNLDPKTGEYRISGLGTDEYLIEAGMYLQLPEEGEEVPMMAAPGVGDVMERALVENDASRPTILDFTLTRGYSVSGRIILSADDPPIYEGAPATIEKDLAGQPVRAVPMDQYFMGDGLAGVKSPLVAQITANPDGTGAYRIDGLSPGVYLLVPPMISLREASEQNLPVDVDFSEMEIRRNWSADPIRVVITDDDSRGQDFVLKNGHSVQGTLILPEAQTLSGQYDQWRWTGYLELQTPENQLLSHAKVFFKGDFNNSDRTGFIFDHVPDGKYILFFWSDQYVSASRQIEILGKDAAVSLEIEPGANIVGKLVDADTGAPVTAKDGIRVICIADPYVEGGYRETIDTYEDYFPDDGILEPVKDLIPEPGSTIESGDALKEGGGQGSADRERPQPGRFHLQAIPAGQKYLLIVEAEHGIKTRGAKNYVGQVISGIEVAQGITGDVDVGTIRLRQGITITGRLTHGDGNPVPNVDVAAFPSDAHEGSAEARGVSDREGYYTIFGIDPDVEYYDLIAAERPWLFDDWGKRVEWGEERRYNIRPDLFDEATGMTQNGEMALRKATASLSGTITIPEKNEFMIPFLSEDGQSYPSAYILLQRKGVVYKDMLEGIEGLTMPRPPEARTAPYRIDHIQPGTYRITFMNYGLPRAVIDNIAIHENEQKVIDAAWDDTFYKVSGDLALLSGGYPTTSDISGVLCMNMADQSVVFGRLTKEADNTYSSYEVAGLSGTDRFQLIFYRESGTDNAPRVFSAGEPFSTGGQDIEMDATLTRDLEPTFILRAIQSDEDPNRIRIAIFSSEYLTDNRFEIAETEPGDDPETGMLYLKTGGGELKDLEYGEDKRSIFATYEKVSTDKTVEILIAGHYRSDNPISDNPGSDEAVKRAVLSFDASASLINSRMVDRFTANRVSMGHGDDTRLFFPAGAMETQQSDNLVITLEKRGRDSSVSLPTGVTQISAPYAVGAGETGTGEEPSLAEPVTVLLEYDPALVSDIDLVHLYYQTDGGWRRADAESRMIDTKNRTISGEVKGLSAFVAGYGKEIVPEPPAPEPQETPKTDIGGGESSDCFIGSLR